MSMAEETSVPMLNNNFEGHPAGHNVAGSCFIIWGLWWLIGTYWIHFTQQLPDVKAKLVGVVSIFSDKRNDPMSYKSWLPVPYCPRAPLEPIFKIVLPGLGIFVESFLDFLPDPKDGGKVKLTVVPLKLVYVENTREFVTMDRLQHVSLYLAFCLSGVVDLISVCFRMPRVTTKIFLTFAFLTEYLTFATHIHGRNNFNMEVHELLMYFIIACIVFSTLRLLASRNLFINTGLAGSMILQGTHLCQAGWILFGGTKWNPDSSTNIQFVSSLTVWHLLSVGLFMVVVFIVMRAAFRWKGKLQYADCDSISAHASDKSEQIELIQIDQDESQDML